MNWKQRSGKGHQWLQAMLTIKHVVYKYLGKLNKVTLMYCPLKQNFNFIFCQIKENKSCKYITLAARTSLR